MKDQNGIQNKDSQFKRFLFRLSLLAVPVAASAITGATTAYMLEGDVWQSAGMALAGGVVALAMLFAMIDIFWGD